MQSCKPLSSKKGKGGVEVGREDALPPEADVKRMKVYPIPAFAVWYKILVSHQQTLQNAGSSVFWDSLMNKSSLHLKQTKKAL